MSEYLKRTVERWWSNFHNQLTVLVEDKIITEETTVKELLEWTRERCPVCGAPLRIHDEKACQRISGVLND